MVAARARRQEHHIVIGGVSQGKRGLGLPPALIHRMDDEIAKGGVKCLAGLAGTTRVIRRKFWWWHGHVGILTQSRILATSVET